MSETLFLIPVQAFELQERGANFDLTFSSDGGSPNVERIPADPFNFLDISPFIQALAGNSVNDTRFDLNGDGEVSFLDISPFIQALSGNGPAADENPSVGDGESVEPSQDLTGVRDRGALIDIYNELIMDPQDVSIAVENIFNEGRGPYNTATICALYPPVNGRKSLECELAESADPNRTGEFRESDLVAVSRTPPFTFGPINADMLQRVGVPESPTFAQWQQGLIDTFQSWPTAAAAFALVDPPNETFLISFLVEHYNHVAIQIDVEPINVDEITDGGDRQVSEREWIEIMSSVDNLPFPIGTHYLRTFSIISGQKVASELLSELNSRLAPAENISALFLVDFPRDMTLAEWQNFVRNVTQQDISFQLRLTNIIQASWDVVPVLPN